MALIGQLTVGIVANTQKAIRNINKFRRSMAITSKTAANAIRPITQFANAFGGIGVGLSAAGVGIVLHRTAQQIDSIGKTSAKLNIATDRLMGLHHGAELSGISIETLNMAIQRSTRRIAEAAQGQGEAVKALQELGLSAKALNMLSPDRQLLKIADAFRLITNPADRVRLAMKLFDSEGVSLVNMLTQGSAGLIKFQKDLESLGGTLTSDEVLSVEKLNNQLSRLQKFAKGGTMKIVVDVAIPGAETIEGFLLFMEQNKKRFKMPSAEALGPLGIATKAGLAGGKDIVGSIAERAFSDIARRTEGGATFSTPPTNTAQIDIVKTTSNFAQRLFDRADESLMRFGKFEAGQKPDLFNKDIAKSFAMNAAREWINAISKPEQLARQRQADEIRLAVDPVFALAQEAAGIKSLVRTGELSVDLATKAIKQRAESLTGGTDSRQTRSINAALERGTSEATRAIFANFKTGEETDKEILKETQKQLVELEKISAALANPKLDVIPN